MDDMEAGGAQGAAPDNSQEQDTGYVIEIRVKPDGSMDYCVEPGAEEDSEEQGEGAEGSKYTPVRGLQDLMSKIKDTIASGGQSPEASDADFKAGLGEEEQQ